MSLVPIILLALKASIVLNVLAIGLSATLSDTTSLFRRPADLARAFLSMNVIMPVLALALVTMFNLHPAVKIALVALSVSPVPPLFPRTALKKGSRGDYAIGLLVTMALLEIIVLPLTMALLARFFGMPLQMSAHSVASLVFITILAPVLIGIGIHRAVPAFAGVVAKPLGVLSSVLLILCVLPVLFVSARTILSLIGNGTILAFAAFGVLGLLAGYVVAGPDPDEKRVLAIATSTRHPGVAVAIAHANFPNQKLVVPAIVLYLIVSAIIVGIAAKRGRAGRTPTQTEDRMAA